MTLAARSQQLPYARTITIGLVELEAYRVPRTDKFFFSAAQLAKKLGDKAKNGVPELLKSRRVEWLAEQEIQLDSTVTDWLSGIDSTGNTKEFRPITIEQASAYIIDLVRKYPHNRIVWATAIALTIDSLKRRVHEKHGIVVPEEEYREQEQYLFNRLNNRRDCDVLERDCECELYTSTELARYLGLPINSSNTHKFAAFMLGRLDSDRVMGRRLYNLYDVKTCRLAVKFFEAEALQEIEFNKIVNPSAFDDTLIDNFSDL
ncbi:MAG: hypothetical protein AAFS12_00030 [Cyanobacteria bacterium J06632_19]